MNKILVVEDNQPLAQSLQSWLSKHYTVAIAGNGKDALELLSKTPFDLLILDLGLPDMTGQELCDQIRTIGIKTPILVLTASNEVSMKVNLLDIGADDYLQKPFYIGELKARLRALLRRSGAAEAAPQLIEVGDLVLDIGRRQVSRAGKTILLRRKEFDILEYLVRNRGTVVTRSMIISSIWEDSSDHLE